MRRVWRWIRYGAELLTLVDEVLDFLDSLQDNQQAQDLWRRIKICMDKIRGR